MDCVPEETPTMYRYVSFEMCTLVNNPTDDGSRTFGPLAAKNEDMESCTQVLTETSK